MIKDNLPIPDCITCGNKTSRHDRKYCSQKCSNIQRRKGLLEKFKAGIKLQDRTIKGLLLETRGHKCEICNTIEWNGKPVPLVLDHISGDSNDSSESNLRLVCGNCDMQLPTYKSKNKGNGRHYRRKRYAEGKSF